jgi:hypothetical protein
MHLRHPYTFRCTACGPTTTLLAQAYTTLRARGKRIELFLVPQACLPLLWLYLLRPYLLWLY